MRDKMTVVVKTPGADPVITQIERRCSALRAFIDGYIVERKIAMDISVIWDDTAALENKAYNCTIRGEKYYGTIIIIGRRGVSYWSLKRPRRVVQLLAEGIL